jgi:hypothetical protein
MVLQMINTNVNIKHNFNFNITLVYSVQPSSDTVFYIRILPTEPHLTLYSTVRVLIVANQN